MKRILIAQLLFVLALFLAKDSFGTAKPVPAIPPVMSDTVVLDSSNWTAVLGGVPGQLVQVTDLIAPNADSAAAQFAIFQVRDVNGAEKAVFPDYSMNTGIVLKPGDQLEGRLTSPQFVPEVHVFWAAKLHR